MSATLINLIIQLIAGAVGGNAAGAAMKNVDPGTLVIRLPAPSVAPAAARFSPRCCRCCRAPPAMSISVRCLGRPLAAELPERSSRLWSAC